MLLEMLLFILRTIAGLMTGLFLLRFYMQWVQVGFYHRIGQVVMGATNFAVKPLRRVLPGFWGIDWASLLSAYVMQLLFVGIISVILGIWSWVGIAIWAFFEFLKAGLALASVVLLIWVILSWVNPAAPAYEVLGALLKPMLAPLRRILPHWHGIDFSAMLALILIQLLYIMLRHMAQGVLPTYFNVPGLGL